MPRLPTPGGDNDAWGTLLNEFLTVAHNSDGTINTAIVPDIHQHVTLTSLRAITTPAVNSYYYTTNSGQEGVWKYDASDTTSVENVRTTIVSSNGKRFKRVYDGAVNIKWFGATGDGATNDTAAIQAAIDYVCSNGSSEGSGGIVFIPKGIYMISKIVLKAGLSIVGESMNASILKDIPGDTEIACFVSPSSLLANLSLKDFQLQGSFNTGKMGIYFDGRGASSNDLRGCTDSVFKNLFIRYFHNHCWWWRGDPNSVYGPQQLSIIENCIIYNHPSIPIGAGARALLFTSQCDQINIKMCHLYTHSGTGQYAVEISREYYNSSTGKYGGYSVGGSVINPPTIIANIEFDTTTIYSYGDPTADARGILLESVNGINFLTSWFETLYKAVDIIQGSVAVSFNVCTFLECGASGTIIESHNVQNFVTATDCLVQYAVVPIATTPFVGIRRLSNEAGVTLGGEIKATTLKAFATNDSGVTSQGNIDQYSAYSTLYQNAGGANVWYGHRWRTLGGPNNIVFEVASGAANIGAETYTSTLLGFQKGGVVICPMTTTQRDAISSPPEGLQIYNTTTHTINFYNGSAWKAVLNRLR